MIPGNANPLLLASAADGATAAAGPIKSVRFNNGDSAYLNRTPSSAGNRKTWTFSCWVKRSELTTGSANSRGLLAVQDGIDDNNYFEFRFIDNKINIAGYSTVFRRTNVLYRDVSAWYHIVLAVDTTSSTADDRIKLYVNGVEVDDFGAKNNPSQNADLAINKAASHTLGSNGTSAYFDGYIADCFLIDGQQLDPTSFGAFDDNGVWQSASHSGTFGTNGFHLFDFANESTVGHDSSGNENDFTANNITSSAANYANAVATASSGEIANGGTSYWIDIVPTNADLDYSGSDFTKVHDGSTTTNVYWVGDQYSSGNVTRARFDLRDFSSISTLRVYGGFSGYTAYNYQLLDSSKSAISGTSGSFGAIGWHSLTVSGSPRYLEISCTSGSNRRFRLYAIEVNGTVLTNDSPSNLDILFDVPTNGTQSETGAGGEVSANYCTLNPLDKATNATLSNGNLQQSYTSGTGAIRGTFAYPKTGKWYYEVTPLASQYTTGYFHVGIATADANLNTNPGYDTTNTFTYWQNGSKTNNVAYGASFTAGDIIGVAFDADAGSLTFYKNGVSQGVNSTGLTGEYFPYAPTWNYNAAYNFGQRPFSYPVSNYLPLSTTNLPTPTIADGSDYFDVKTWDGNSSTQSITGLEFSPDWVWIKTRSTTGNHDVYDSVRGVYKYLNTDTTAAEVTNTDGVTSFNSDGWTMGNRAKINYAGRTYVGWAWDAGANSSKTYTVKVVSDSGNKYRFDDFGTSAVTLDLEEGSTYVFDQSDSSNSGHPLRFSTTSDGTHNSGSEYTTGVTTTGTPGSAGAKTTIVVGSGVATLYYYCSAHSGMGGQANTNSTAGASNFDGTIQSTVRASQTAGFSIVTYNGNGSNSQTVGHGLNAAPQWVIYKRRAAGDNWKVYHHTQTATKLANLNTTDAFTSNNDIGTAPTSSVISVSSSDSTYLNDSSNNAYLALCFAPVANYSQFGAYSGNGDASDGNFVYLPFRPAFLLIKDSTSTGYWYITDSGRNPANDGTTSYVWANTSGAEQSDYIVDLLSNGFRFLTASGNLNASGRDYIYCAFASNPFSSNGGLAR